MSQKQYDPRPVYEMVAKSLIKAIESEDWLLVTQIYEQMSKLAEK